MGDWRIPWVRERIPAPASVSKLGLREFPQEDGSPQYLQKAIFLSMTGSIGVSTKKGPAMNWSVAAPTVQSDGSLATTPGILSGRGVGIIPQFTQYISNPTCSGAVVGSPGTLPTGWQSGASNGISFSVVAVGDSYVDISISGTATATAYPSLRFLTEGVVPASVGQSVSLVANMLLISGSLSGISNNYLMIFERNSSYSYLTESHVTFNTDGSQTWLKTTVANATTAYIQPCLSFTVSSGASVNAVFRISRPNLTKTAYLVPYLTSAATSASTAATSSNNGLWATLDSAMLEAFRGVPGTELLNNSEFTSDISGWTNSSVGSGTVVWENGAAKLTRLADSSNRGILSQSVVGTVGQRRGIECYNKATATGSVSMVVNGSTLLTLAPGDYGRAEYLSDGDDSVFLYPITNNSVVLIDYVRTHNLTAQPFTLATVVTMGSGSSELPSGAGIPILSVRAASEDILYANEYSGSYRIARSYDSTNRIFVGGTWNRLEQQYKLVQVNTAGTQFRVGNLRVGIDSAIQWSSWSTYDGSFDPLTALRIGYGTTVPFWWKGTVLYSGQQDDALLLRACQYIARG